MIRFTFVSRWLGAMALISLGMAATGQDAAPAKDIKFVMHRLGNVRSEACCVADFNGDGKLDVAAGAYLYLNPAFQAQDKTAPAPIKIREIKGEVDEKGKGYAWDFMNEPLDVDGDGRTDIVAADWFQKQAWWYRNPGPGKEGLWQETLLVQNGNYETAMLADVDGDGKANEILPHIRPAVWYEFTKGSDGKIGAAVHTVSKREMDFGVGAGDLNGDGRPDIIRSEAWYEAPADLRQGEWKEHPLTLGVPQKSPKIAKHLSMMLVEDINADGLNDIVCTMAHGYGISWFEQVRQDGAISFKRHEIDASWTQAHAIKLADLDGDGINELVTGKRFMAHNGSDPEELAPLRVYYYKRTRGPQGVNWTRHTISFDQGIGAGMNIPVMDLDGDGDLDIVVTGKWGGPVWFENKSK